MSISYRRYEILLPRRFNDGQPVPNRLITEVILELRQHFGAVSCETQVIRGEWENAGEVYHDQVLRLFVDVEDKLENRRFFLDLKERLKSRFQQIEIWLTSYPVDVL
jgi:hypothetical protein